MEKLICLILAVYMLLVTAGCNNTYGMDATEMGEEASGLALSIGDYITMGKYYDQPILWRCIDIDENGPLMLSDKILCRKPFDVYADVVSGSHVLRDPAESVYRRSRESNYWGDSTIRSWLNSSASEGNVEWLCGNAPTPSFEWSGRNGYDQEKGFLADGNFTESERNLIKNVTQKSLLDRTDMSVAQGGGDEWGKGSFWLEEFIEEQRYDKIYYEYLTDRVFLLDIKQLLNMVQNEDILGEEYHNSTLTQEAIDCDELNKYRISKGDPPLSADKPYSYYLRTPYGYKLSGGTGFSLSKW